MPKVQGRTAAQGLEVALAPGQGRRNGSEPGGLRPSPYSVFLHESCRYPDGRAARTSNGIIGSVRPTPAADSLGNQALRAWPGFRERLCRREPVDLGRVHRSGSAPGTLRSGAAGAASGVEHQRRNGVQTAGSALRTPMGARIRAAPALESGPEPARGRRNRRERAPRRHDPAGSGPRSGPWPASRAHEIAERGRRPGRGASHLDTRAAPRGGARPWGGAWDTPPFAVGTSRLDGRFRGR